MRKLMNVMTKPKAKRVPQGSSLAALQAQPGRRRNNFRPTADDYEFLPAALEVLETPPSPVRLAIMGFFAVLVAAALAWGWFGQFGIIVAGQGKIQPPGRVKVVQTAEAMKLMDVKVSNGDTVRKGQVLAEFDGTEARADLAVAEEFQFAIRAELARREAAIAAARNNPALVVPPAPVWPAMVPERFRQREAAVLNADVSRLRSDVGEIDAQIELKRQERRSTADAIDGERTLIANLKERLDMERSLASSGASNRANILEHMNALVGEELRVTGLEGKLRETDAAIGVLFKSRHKIIQTFITENTNKKSDASRNLDELVERAVKARRHLDNMTLVAPVDGVLLASSLYTKGQVVGAGQEVLRIVPAGERFEVEAYFPNKDIGFVREGQNVAVKVDSFPYSRFGMLEGKVSYVAKDAIPIGEAGQIEGNPVKPGESAMFAGAQRTQNLYFPVTISLGKPKDGMKLTAGMTVTAEINTGKRRILEYFLSPVLDVSSSSLRER